MPLTLASSLRRSVCRRLWRADRKSTRLNSSHLVISYAVFCLKNIFVGAVFVVQLCASERGGGVCGGLVVQLRIQLPCLCQQHAVVPAALLASFFFFF